MQKRTRSRRMSMLIAFCGMSASLSVTLMLAGGLIPVATYITPLLAAALLLPIRIEFSWKAALATWAAAALLSLILGLDKEAAFFYLFIGWWPLAKWPIDLHIRAKAVRFLLKTVIFVASIGAMYAMLIFVLHLDAVAGEFGEMGVWMTISFFVMAVVALHLYDFLLMPLSILYVRRIQPRLRFLRSRS